MKIFYFLHYAEFKWGLYAMYHVRLLAFCISWFVDTIVTVKKNLVTPQRNNY